MVSGIIIFKEVQATDLKKLVAVFYPFLKGVKLMPNEKLEKIAKEEGNVKYFSQIPIE